MERYTQIVNFIKEVEKLKRITRISLLSDGKTQEDDTQHSWHMAMILMTIKDEIGIRFDMLKVMKMIMIHDLGEIYVGDVFVGFDQEAKKLKDQRERESLQKLLSLLPEDLAHEFHELVEEYEARNSIESKIVKALDKIQYQIQYLASGGLYKGKGTFHRTVEEDYLYGKKSVEFNEYLHEMLKDIIEDGKQYD